MQPDKTIARAVDPVSRESATGARPASAATGVVLAALVVSTPVTAIVEAGSAVALDCVRAVLEARGESVLKVDAAHGRVATGLRRVGPETLAKIAALRRGREQQPWAGGIYQLTVVLSPAEPDRNAVQVSARILGAGGTSRYSMRPSHWVPLPSTGRLEQATLSALAGACPVTPKTSPP